MQSANSLPLYSILPPCNNYTPNPNFSTWCRLGRIQVETLAHSLSWLWHATVSDEIYLLPHEILQPPYETRYAMTVTSTVLDPSFRQAPQSDSHTLSQSHFGTVKPPPIFHSVCSQPLNQTPTWYGLASMTDGHFSNFATQQDFNKKKVGAC